MFIFSAGVLAGTSGLFLCLKLERMTQPRIAFAATTAPSMDAAFPIPRGSDDDLHRLLARDLSMPIRELDVGALRDTFTETRPGRKTHEAIDIRAERGTPVHALGDGVIQKLATSERGGISIYEFDPENQYCYFYAHLDRYANHLREGLHVQHGDIIGYVGLTGDAGLTGPHLHLAIARLQDEKNWWEGAPVNPFPLLLAIGGSGAEGTN